MKKSQKKLRKFSQLKILKSERSKLFKDQKLMQPNSMKCMIQKEEIKLLPD
jgi:hypothetical protein